MLRSGHAGVRASSSGGSSFLMVPSPADAGSFTEHSNPPCCARQGFRPSRERQTPTPASGVGVWRSGRDSNPRYPFEVYSLSRGALSTTQPPLREAGRGGVETIAAGFRQWQDEGLAARNSWGAERTAPREARHAKAGPESPTPIAPHRDPGIPISKIH